MRLYHYCTLSTFENIYLSRKFRLFDITKSNDSKEIVYGLHIFKETMIAAYNATKAKYFIDSINMDLFVTLVDEWVRDIEVKLNTSNLNICYVVCFSQEQDLLSQWRGYADDGRGLSFGIDKVKLHAWASAKKFVLKKIEYNKSQQRKQMREISNDVVRLIKASLNKKKPKLVKDIINESLDKYESRVLEMAVSMKSNFFKEEKEWRLFVFDKQLNSDFIRNNTILSKSYIEITLDDILSYNGNESHIVIGPKCSVTPEDVKRFLVAQESNVIISASKGSYR